jgi:hypothetical protein
MSLDSFHISKGHKYGVSNTCKQCKNAYSKQKHIENKFLYGPKKYRKKTSAEMRRLNTRNAQVLIEYFSRHPCIDCGNDDVRVLEFDHFRDKEFNVSKLRAVAKQRLLDEIDKCEVRCSNCHLIKTKSEQVKLATNKYIIRNKEFVLLYLHNNNCVDCGESNIDILEFDHVRGKKRANVSSMASSRYAISAIEKEIQKCDVRCRNCHRIKTYERSGSWRERSYD